MKSYIIKTITILTLLSLTTTAFAQENKNRKTKNKADKISISEPAKEGAARLPTVTVLDKAEAQDGYHDNGTYIGKMYQTAKEVPQSLTIISSNLMYDRNLFSLKDVLKNAGGIAINMTSGGSGGTTGDNFSIRGNDAKKDLYLDGLRDPYQYFRDTFNLESVEVLRGSSSVLFGRGSIGGAVNQVSKEPTLTDGSQLNFTGGSHSFGRETVDINKKIGKNSAIRLNLMKTDSKSYRDVVEKDSFGIAPSVKFGINTDNELTISYYKLQYSQTPDLGIPIKDLENQEPALPVDNFYGLKFYDQQQDSAEIFSAKLLHKIDQKQSITTIIRRAEIKRDFFITKTGIRATDVNLTGPGVVNGRGGDEITLSAQSNYNGKFNLLKKQHDILVGIEYVGEKLNSWRINDKTINNRTDSLNPNYNYFIAENIALRKGSPSHIKIDNYATYAQDLFEIAPKWKVLVGGRYDIFKTDYDAGFDTLIGDTNNFTTQSDSYKNSDEVLSYRASLMYQPNDNSNYYLMQATSYSPTGDRDVTSIAEARKLKTSATEKNVNTEIGAKWEFFEDTLSVRTALFHSKKDKERELTATSRNYLLTGQNHTDGFEAEVNGKVNAKVDLFATLTIMRNRVDNDLDTAIEGSTKANFPRASGNIWATYKILPKLKIGAGSEFVNTRQALASANAGEDKGIGTRVPGYTIFDAMIGWYDKKYTVKLNIFNLFDKEYYEALHSEGSRALPGYDRSAQLTLSYRF